MKIRQLITTITIAITLLLGYSNTVFAQSPLSLTEFRQHLSNYGSAINGCGRVESVQDSSLIIKISELTDEQLLTLHSAIPNWDNFLYGTNSVISLCRATDKLATYTAESSDKVLAAISEVSYSPDYPAGGNYDTFIATLPGLGLLDNGKTNRTDANGVAGAWIAIETLKVAAIIAQGVCDAAPSGDIVFTNVVLCPPSAVAWEAVQSTQIVLDQTGFQDSLIDSAEIEATYENSKTIITNTFDIYNDLQQHDENITNQIQQHDADIKAKLDLLNGKIDVLLSRQLEIVRLLATPQGQRATDVLACDGGPCTFPNKSK